VRTLAEELVIHVQLYYKLDQAKDQYIKLLPVTESGDMIMEKTIPNEKSLGSEANVIAVSGVTTLTEVIERITDALNRRALSPYYQPAQKLAEDNPIIAAGQFAIESDNHGVKVGNGVNNYLDLPYIVDPSIATTALENS
jgi:hypothetical protein